MFGLATDDQWEKMKKFIKSDKYKKEDFFVFETMAVGDRVVPDRFQKLTKPALEVMAQDAKKGVSLMLNHNEGQLGVQSIPIGKVFDSRIEQGTQDGEQNALYLTQYILKDDSKVDGYSKNDIIKLIESGTIEDTSVGFSVPFETATCSVCHNKYFSSECSHFRGRKYVVNEETGERRTCILEVNPPEYSEIHVGNNMLIENSVVFDGAYPNAMIQQSINGDILETPKGNLKVLNGENKEEVKSNLIGFGSKYGLELMYKPFEEKGGKLMDEAKENSEKLSADVENEENVENTENVETETATQSATQSDTETDTQTEEVAEATQETVEQKATVEELFSVTKTDVEKVFGDLSVTKDMILTLAKEGKEYRNKVIEEALNSGVRSMGNSFNKESFRKSFEQMSTQDILNTKESFEEDVKQKFGNSRVSKVNENENSKEEFKFSKQPDVSTLKTFNY